MQANNLSLWLALKFVPRLAIHKKIALVQEFGIQKLFTTKKSRSVLTTSHGISTKQLAAFEAPDWTKINSVIEQSKQCNSELIAYEDEYYPQQLKQIYDPPLILFIQGNKKLLNKAQLAIVGSRNASIEAREISFTLAKELSRAGIVVTSGLALGVDAAAHKGTLAVIETTIAVVATGLDSVYPSRHKKLVQDILMQHGVIVSEFVPGTKARAGHFPKRNRIISGLSLGVLVVEATIKSGSLITARCAIEQNREVFAIPSSINNAQAKGCHWLIKQGAKLVEGFADIMEELNLVGVSGLHLAVERRDQQKPQQTINNIENKKNPQKDLCEDALLASVGFEITPVDRVVSRSKLPVEEVLTRLTVLELSGLVSAVPGGYLRVK